MHDFYEGICHYDLSNIILYFIHKKFCTLNELNDRISNFPYNKYETQYIPKILTIDKLKNNNLKMTAREMVSFVNFFGFIIGDLIEDSDPAWTLYKTLLKIMDILLGSHFFPETLTHLNSLVENHNTLFLNLFGSLKPKMHMATHYATCIKASGPPRHYMCFRCETKHREFKKYANVISCRKNLLLSLTLKYQLQFCHQYLNGWKEFQLELNENWSTSSAYLSTFPELSM